MSNTDQWRNISCCFLKTIKTVSPSSGSFDSTNIQVQNPLTRSRSIKLKNTFLELPTLTSRG